MARSLVDHPGEYPYMSNIRFSIGKLTGRSIYQEIGYSTHSGTTITSIEANLTSNQELIKPNIIHTLSVCKEPPYCNSPISLAKLDFLEPMYCLVCSTLRTRNSMGLGCKKTNNIRHNNNDSSREANYQDTGKDGKKTV